jgi:hypothetical protein
MSDLDVIRQFVTTRLSQTDDPRLWYDLFYDMLKADGKSYVTWRARQIRLREKQLKFKFPHKK